MSKCDKCGEKKKIATYRIIDFPAFKEVALCLECSMRLDDTKKRAIEAYQAVMKEFDGETPSP